MRVIHAADSGEVLREIVVRLVEYHNYVLGNLVEKMIELLRRNERAGWIVRIGDVDNACMLIDRRGYRAQIKSIRAHRNLDKLSSSRLRGNGVHNERTFAGDRVEPRREQSARNNAQ